MWVIVRFFVILLYFEAIIVSEDLYSTLGVKRTATIKDIKKAYRQKARDTHPDKLPPGSDTEATTAQFRKVVEAYETLSDTKVSDK